jgi:hypothetical protein
MQKQSHARSPELARGTENHREGFWTQRDADSLKMLWRATKCLVQRSFVHPFLALHSLPTLPRCQLRSAQLLSECTDNPVLSDKSCENAGSGSSDYVRGKVLFWLSGVYDRGLRGIPSVPCLRLAQEPRRGWNCASNEEMWREKNGETSLLVSAFRDLHIGMSKPISANSASL